MTQKQKKKQKAKASAVEMITLHLVVHAQACNQPVGITEE